MPNQVGVRFAKLGAPAKRGTSGGGPPPPFQPSLQFDDERNSQYVPLVFISAGELPVHPHPEEWRPKK